MNTDNYSRVTVISFLSLLSLMLSQVINQKITLAIPPPVPNSMLENAWVFVQWDSVAVPKPPISGTEIMAQFSQGRVSGSSGCNRYKGSYTTAGSQLTVGTISATRKVCPSPIMQQESKYFAALTGAKSFEITGLAQLLITYKTPQSSGVLVFDLQPPQASTSRRSL